MCSLHNPQLPFICETADTKESEAINGYKSHVYKREITNYCNDCRTEPWNTGFDNDEIKDILYYMSTIEILILSILFYFNKCSE